MTLRLKFILGLVLTALSGAAFADPVSAGFALYTAYAGAAALATAQTAAAYLVAGMTMAGGVMSLYGNAAGDSKLQKYGNLLGLAGNVGLAAGVGKGGAEAAAADVAKDSMAPPPAEGLSQSEVPIDSALSGSGEALAPAADAATGPAAEQLAGAALDSAPASGLIDKGLSPQATVGAQDPLIVQEARAGMAPAGSSQSIMDSIRTASESVGSFVRQNKELVKLGSGAIDGYMKARDKRDALSEARADEGRRREQYNSSILNSRIGFSVNPGQNVNAVTPTDPTKRFVPSAPPVPQPAPAGLINRVAQRN